MITDNSIFNLSDFDSYKEGNRREVKRARGGLPNSLWETYSAFANTNGGVIILGVDENSDGSWKTSGLKKTDTAKLIKNFWDCVNDVKKVSICLLKDKDVNTYEIEDDLIIVIFVPRAERALKPVFINNDMFTGTFKRNGEGDYHCTKLQVKSMLRDQEEDTMDMRVVERFDLSVIDSDTLRAYRNNHKTKKPEHPWVNLSDENFLVRIGAAKLGEDDKLHPTCAGLLMFGTEPMILYEYPEYFLDYREEMETNVRWTERLQSMAGDWSGNLYDFFYRVYNRIQKYVAKPFKLEGIYRVEDTPVHKALREALVNCIANTDFSVPRGIVIRMNQDTLTLENPGTIRVGKDQMFKGGVSDPRNKAIMKMFSLLDIGERAGSGFPQILETWEEEKWAKPIVEESGDNVDRTKVTLLLKNGDEVKNGTVNGTVNGTDKDLSETERVIYETMGTNKNITIEELVLQIKKSRRTIVRTINSLKEKGYIRREGSDKSGSWIILK